MTDQAKAESAITAARAVLGAYDRHILPITAGYLADTLRMLLAAVDPGDGAVGRGYALVTGGKCDNCGWPAEPPYPPSCPRCKFPFGKRASDA